VQHHPKEVNAACKIVDNKLQIVSVARIFTKKNAHQGSDHVVLIVAI
jgi:hypothetical protein